MAESETRSLRICGCAETTRIRESRSCRSVPCFRLSHPATGRLGSTWLACFAGQSAYRACRSKPGVAAVFGQGLVKTSDDFGTRGDKPTHPELLDWLASEFIRGGWSRKQIIRTIVTSSLATAATA